MLSYYPPLQPYATHRLAVESPHNLYLEESGNPKGLPAVIVHGGPGSGISEDARRCLDPNVYHIIAFDQRGAGRATPHAELQGNNTQALVQDMEAIRKFFKLDKWILFGGSWGSTLSLLYAQAYPQNVMGLILSSIFLARRQDLDWIYAGKGANEIFPDHWQEFLAPIPENHRHDLVEFYYDLLSHPDEKIRIKAAKAWSNWEGRMMTLLPDKEFEKKLTEPHRAVSFARTSCHYCLNNFFLEPNQILSNIKKIQHLQGIIIHGRYDMVCPLENAWALHQAWPSSQLKIINDAGHARSEPGILDAVIHATQRFAINL